MMINPLDINAIAAGILGIHDQEREYKRYPARTILMNGTPIQKNHATIFGNPNTHQSLNPKGRITSRYKRA